ncbi:uncharacterized protein C16orf95 homolog isoform X3 [Microcebus murinus]|uniref:uncharacterized protein C16orf95 homolog isoform X3 n=1 Tax=Microcebus murinus TaxID=30608 RepID=UPI000643111F|nr:uncharacterized protein C16orf95 homolog isoform X3 [Microcebus murinus]
MFHGPSEDRTANCHSGRGGQNRRRRWSQRFLQERQSTFQTFRKEVCLTDHSIPKRLRSYIPQTTKMCPCPCHRFGGHLPVPRDQAAMPYWVPRVLRSQKQVARRQQSAKGIQEAPLDSSSRHNRWRICCDDGRLLLRWQQLQALHGDRPPVPGPGASGPTYLLPLGLCLLALLQAVLRVIMAIRFFGFEVGIFSYCREHQQKC